MEKSMQYIDRIASHTVSESCEDDPDVVKKAANGRVYPKRRVAIQHNAAPIQIKGRRLPKRDFELSASTPIKGWTMRPERGPARKTTAISGFDRPRDNK
jgi:hypothetical protein